MRTSVLTIHEGLLGTGRLGSLARLGLRVSTAELVVLVFLGLCAAAMSLLKLNLGIPGHNILRIIFPMALGLALVPRRGAASIMGLSSCAAAGLLMLGPYGGLGVGAMTSLALTGVLLDLALSGARNGRSVCLRLILAGLAANLAAFAVKAGSRLLGFESGHVPLSVWLPKAAVTYTVCGAAAGWLSAIAWFRLTDKTGNAGKANKADTPPLRSERRPGP